MKKSFRIFSILLALTLLVSAMSIPVSAAIPPQPYGDVDRSNIIDVMDATVIQQYVAKINQQSIYYLEAADVDDDASISVIDATIIQQYVAKNISEFPAGKEFYIDKYFHGVSADYRNDKAMVGYPITFTASGSMSPGPTTMRLYVNDELVASTSKSRENNPYLRDITYTFDKAGAYRVKITLSDKWGDTQAIGGSSWTALYIVKDAPTDTSTPIITSIIHSHRYVPTDTFTVNTKFGTEPYKYRYTLYNFDMEMFTTDYLDTNTLKLTDVISSEEYLNIGKYTIKVELVDANGKTTTDKLTFEVEPVVVG